MSDSSIIFIEFFKKRDMKTLQQDNTKIKKDTESFGEYFDAQYERLREMLSNKDRKLHKEWEEEYNKNKKRKKENEK
tara:strand:- start:225 stop:455 length:231 start_codon:yes stop_codon:yes gene_type:complete